LLADELKDYKVRVNTVNPGPTRTALRAKAFPGEAPSGLPKPKAAAEAIVELACATDAPESGEIVRLSSTKHRN